MNSLYTSPIAEIEQCVENFYLFQEQAQYHDALTNARKFAEGFCKLVILHEKNDGSNSIEYQTRHGRTRYDIKITPTNYEFKIKKHYENNYKLMMLGSLIPEVKKIRTQHRLSDKTENYLYKLQGKGNKPTHATGGYHKPTNAICEALKPKIKFLVKELFRFIGEDVTPKLKSSMGHRLKTLHAFIPTHKYIETAKNRRFLFSNELLFFTASEKKQHKEITHSLTQKNVALLIGNPAKGKSTTAMHIAKIMQASANESYQSYYSNLNRKHANIWDDIQKYEQHKIIFILDDCHLDVNEAASIYSKFQGLRNPKACLLFISREISTHQKQSHDEGLNIYDELKNNKFQILDTSKDEDKILGIAEKYKAYYQDTYEGTYEIGDKDKLIKKVHKNLRVLSFYLDHWKKQANSPLSSIEQKDVLTAVYNKYFEPLRKQQKEYFLAYLSLYNFEISFEAIPTAEDWTKGLEQDGLLIQDNENFYVFDHSETAKLLLEAFEIGDKSFRKYGSLDNLYFSTIKQYILSFEEYQYPDNLHRLLGNILSKDRSLWKEFIQDESIEDIILKYYAQTTNDYAVSVFISRLFEFPNKMLQCFKTLIWDNQSKQAAFINQLNGVVLYVELIGKLRRHKDILENFMQLWTPEKELKLFQSAELYWFNFAIEKANKYIPEKAHEIYNKLSLDFLIQKIKTYGDIRIGELLTKLEKIDKNKTQKLYRRIIDEGILDELFKNTTINQIPFEIEAFKEMDNLIVKELFQRISEKKYIHEMIESSTSGNISSAISHLKKMNLVLTKRFFQSIPDQVFINAFNTFLSHEIENLVSWLYGLDRPKTKRIFLAIEDDKFETSAANDEKAKEKIFQKIVTPYMDKAIKEIDDSSDDFAKAMEQAKKNRIISLCIELKKINWASPYLDNIGYRLYQLYQIAPTKAEELYDSWLKNNTLQKALENVELDVILYTLQYLHAINPAKTKTLYSSLDNAILKKKIEATSVLYGIRNSRYFENMEEISAMVHVRYENGERHEVKDVIPTDCLENIGYAFVGLHQIDAQKTRQIYTLTRESIISKTYKLEDFIEVLNIFKYLVKIDEDYIRRLSWQCDYRKIKHNIHKNLDTILHILHLLNLINPALAKMFFGLYGDRQFLVFIRKLELSKIGEVLYFLQTVDAEKAKVIYQLMDNEQLKQLLHEADFDNMGKAVYHLHHVDKVKTDALYKTLSTERLTATIEDIAQNINGLRKPDLIKISNGLGYLYQVYPKETKSLYDSIDSIVFEELVRSTYFLDLGQALLVLSNINLEKTKEIYSVLKKHHVTNSNTLHVHNNYKQSAARKSFKAQENYKALQQIDPVKTEQIIKYCDWVNVPDYVFEEVLDVEERTPRYIVESK